ncbi:pyruvate, phosphate dikinase [Cardinium endosymbiont of Philonthus spinipes]|uniref:pyruvate, phosphate dikinase n=1 Tax=Cardinium endosymbiont of Philonthus spinipes TaxID=3077941 RepID=UPI00313E797B
MLNKKQIKNWLYRFGYDTDYANSPLSKAICDEQFLGEAKSRTAEYSAVFEEHRQASTPKLPLEIEFRKRAHADRSLLGNKGYGLAQMSYLGFPIPPGFTITTDGCRNYYDQGQTLAETIWDQVVAEIKLLEKATGKQFGSAPFPLLLSVRSGAKTSMPGMMDTLLNLGLNDETTELLGHATQDARFAYDSYRRFIEMYSSIIMGIDHHLFVEVVEEMKAAENVHHEAGLGLGALHAVIDRYKKIVWAHTGTTYPQDVFEQLRKAIVAIFASWNGPRAVTYRTLNHINDQAGTAVTIQSMVFGNRGTDSLTGVLFTRNPSTGEPTLFGEYLINAQGEELVSGLVTPRQITRQGRQAIQDKQASLEEAYPVVFNELRHLAMELESHFKEMQDIEYTVEQGKLWLLQTRNGKRSAKAAVKIAVDMVCEGKIDAEEAVQRIDYNQIEQLLHATLDAHQSIEILTHGLPAAPGVASGVIVCAPEEVAALSKTENVILVRGETSPDDIGSMAKAAGILTTKGGMTAHAAVVARGMGKPCICGARGITIDMENRLLLIGQTKLPMGSYVTIDGTTGAVIKGKVATVQQKPFPEFVTFMGLVDQLKRMEVRANAETVQDATVALSFGIAGIGLCRTEHMFFNVDDMRLFRKMILMSDATARLNSLRELLVVQKRDFKALFQTLHGLPITVRLLDPPLHEFLPHHPKEIAELALQLGCPLDEVAGRIEELDEVNPMLGHRGARLAITFPEMYAMQVQALFEAALEVEQVALEIMLPLVFDAKEVIFIKNIIETVHQKTAPHIPYKVGVMIELPRAALQAATIAPLVDFFSIGTNDLTQTTLGISRDDGAKFLDSYQQKGLLQDDPFVTLDREGVGALIHMAVVEGRSANPNLKIGICGEHGGDPRSIEFFESIGIDYISCSPYRVAIAKLAAAKAMRFTDVRR